MSKRSGFLFLTRLRHEDRGGFIIKYPCRERIPKRYALLYC